MADFTTKTVVKFTRNDRSGIARGGIVLDLIKSKMRKDNKYNLVNDYTGEVIEYSDITKALWVLDSLLDSQEDWTWTIE